MGPGPEVFSGRLLVSNRSYFSSKCLESFQFQPELSFCERSICLIVFLYSNP